ncbi:hypothetical protein EK904_010547 [Melospiza melodia maxima]|nr:hypothetical protein EK904_010547 [Melospiza melodia maxima]
MVQTHFSTIVEKQIFSFCETQEEILVEQNKSEVSERELLQKQDEKQKEEFIGKSVTLRWVLLGLLSSRHAWHHYAPKNNKKSSDGFKGRCNTMEEAVILKINNLEHSIKCAMPRCKMPLLSARLETDCCHFSHSIFLQDPVSPINLHSCSKWKKE